MIFTQKVKWLEKQLIAFAEFHCRREQIKAKDVGFFEKWSKQTDYCNSWKQLPGGVLEKK